MPKNNEITKRVFGDLVEISPLSGEYDNFLKVDEVLGLPTIPLLNELKDQYKTLVNDNIKDLKTLAALEEIIIQIRCRNTKIIESELRLSLSRDYIYARTIFYRRGMAINDIRVLVGKTDKYGDDITSLVKDPEFRNICILELLRVMRDEVNKNIVQLNQLLNEKEISISTQPI